MIEKKTLERSSRNFEALSPNSPRRAQAKPVSTAITSTCRRLPSAKAPKKASGISANRCSATPSASCAFLAYPAATEGSRSEEHTSELQSRENLVCRLLLEKKKTKSTSIK